MARQSKGRCSAEGGLGSEASLLTTSLLTPSGAISDSATLPIEMAEFDLRPSNMGMMLRGEERERERGR